MKTGSVTLADIRRCVDVLKKNVVKPAVVKTKKQAATMNRFNKLMGLESRWKVGDEYYLALANDGRSYHRHEGL